MSNKNKKEKSSMELWAEREVELAIKMETQNTNEDNAEYLNEYVTSVYKCALGLYKTFVAQGHSGMSAELTRQVFNRLADHKVLKPIDLERKEDWGEPDFRDTCQNKRYSSLFRTNNNETYEYNDVSRVVVAYDDMDSRFHNGKADRIVNELYPIESPYMPEDKPYIVRAKRVVLDPKTETEAVMYYGVDRGDGPGENICYCWKENEDGSISEITEEEFEALQKQYGGNKEE